MSRRRVSMVPNRLRRGKRDPSGLSEVDEDAAAGRPGRHKNAIFNDEIARLLIREEDLVKVSQEARAAAGNPEAFVASADTPAPADGDPSPTYRRVAVRKEIPEALRRPPLRRVVLLRRAPPDAPLRESDPAEWRSGPRLDSRGNVVAHSLLGRPEEFYRIGLLRGHLLPQDVPPAYRPEWTQDLVVEEDASGGDAARQTESAAGSVEFHWTSDRPGRDQLPAMDSQAEDNLESPRAHNGKVLERSGLAMRRVTEQINQCGIASSMMRHLTISCSDFDSGRQRRSGSSSTASASASSVAAACAARSVRLAGPQYSFIGGWSYQKEVLLG